MSLCELEDKRKAVEDASLLDVLLTNAISIIIFIANDEQSLAEAVSAKTEKV